MKYKKYISITAAAMMVCALLLSMGCTADNKTRQADGAQQSTKEQTQSSSANMAQQSGADGQTATQTSEEGSYVVNDTGQAKCYDNTSEISAPSEGDAFYGQDAQYVTNEMSFTDNKDGTVTDNNTGLMWSQSPLDDKLTWDEAMAGADDFDLAGYDDWRLPTIKEMYSLIDFNGTDPSVTGDDTSGLIPFIDTDYFDFEYGDTDAGERIIDVQYASSTKYVSTEDGELAFGVNMADGRIKGYWLSNPTGGEKTFVVMYVRGNEAYGQNNFIDNGDGTITDLATGLMWMTSDSGEGMEWEDALEWSEQLDYAGYDDWRLPDAKELQSIVDYTRSPDTTNSAAINPLFECSQIVDEGGSTNYPFYWTSTTHISERGGQSAAYIAFGEALGFMSSEGAQTGNEQIGNEQMGNGQTPPKLRNGEQPEPGQRLNAEAQGASTDQGDYTLRDVHGAGAQRSDPKTGDASDYPTGHGPQGDVIRIDNYVRCVRSVEVG